MFALIPGLDSGNLAPSGDVGALGDTPHSMLNSHQQIPMGCGGVGNATGQPWTATSCLGDNLMQVAYQADWYAANVLQVSGGGERRGDWPAV